MDQTKTKCPLCDHPIPISDLAKNDGWFTCAHCKNEIRLLRYSKNTVRIPVYTPEQAAKLLAER